MGAVFRGTDTALGRTVAVKVLLQQYSDDEETTQRFQNEAQSTAAIGSRKYCSGLLRRTGSWLALYRIGIY